MVAVLWEPTPWAMVLVAFVGAHPVGDCMRWRYAQNRARGALLQTSPQTIASPPLQEAVCSWFQGFASFC